MVDRAYAGAMKCTPFALLTALAFTGSLLAEPSWPKIKYTEILTGVDFPIAIRHAGDGSGRLFIVGRQGDVSVLEGDVSVLEKGQSELKPFLTIRDRVQSSGNQPDEQGLLGIAFPPGFGKAKRHFYLYYTAKANKKQRISRFKLKEGTTNEADPTSEQILIEHDDPFPNHNGGDIHFGPDGYLYIGTGDGGSADDPKNAAQNPKSPLGKMLRIDVENAGDKPYRVPEDNPFVGQDGVLPEIWHLGLRNPWRWSFDRKTNDMWIADVGQNLWEEVNFVPAGTKGLNFGWRRYESFRIRPGEPENGGTAITIGQLTEPIAETLHTEGDLSITGGYVYRGKANPEWDGVYFFADYLSTRVFALQNDGGKWVKHNYGRSEYLVSAFGEDEDGEVYLAHLGSRPNQGKIVRLDAAK